MNDRVNRLRRESLEAVPSVSIERALLLTGFYRENEGRWPAPLMRARAFHHLCTHKRLYLGDGELIVGERGPEPKATPTYPEITCHSVKDLEILGSRKLTSYEVAAEDIERFAAEVIPFWEGRSLRDRVLDELPGQWHDAYSAGVFTEFMEQRAPGHTVADGKIYRKGLLDFQREIAVALEALGDADDAEREARRHQLEAMDIAADAAMVFARRHAELAREKAAREADPQRRAELERIAAVCDRVPAHAPRDFHEALQTYWFYHLGGHHRAQRLGRLQPRPPRPASRPVLRPRTGRRPLDPRRGRRSCWGASSSSSTTTRRRPRSA